MPSSNQLFQKIFEFIKNNNLISQNSKVILGLSGGPDSVFLLYFLHDLKKIINFDVIAAHLDHEWRINSGLDVDFCKKMCHELNIPFISAKASELKTNIKFNGSKEEIGRKMRRYFFEKVAQEYNADRIALAHHAQDQEETFFIRLIRGTSLSGLTGIKPIDSMYIRPLLQINKQELVKYLETHAIPYLVDPSNESPEFLRNRIRNTVLPALRECDQRFDQNFERTLEKLQKADDFITNIAKNTLENISQIKNDYTYLDLNEFFELDEFLQHEVLLQWLIKEKVPFIPTEKFFNEILRFFKQPESKTHQIHHEWSIEKKKNLVRIKTL